MLEPVQVTGLVNSEKDTLAPADQRWIRLELLGYKGVVSKDARSVRRVTVDCKFKRLLNAKTVLIRAKQVERAAASVNVSVVFAE